jgi:hypothetical protein
MRLTAFVGGVTEYRASSLDRVQRGVRTTSPAHTGTGGGT